MADHRTGTCLLTENRSVETKTEADTYNLDKDINDTDSGVMYLHVFMRRAISSTQYELCSYVNTPYFIYKLVPVTSQHTVYAGRSQGVATVAKAIPNPL